MINSTLNYNYYLKISFCFFVLILFSFSCIADSSGTDSPIRESILKFIDNTQYDDDLIKSFKDALKQLLNGRTGPNNADNLRAWDDYLLQHTGFTNDEYLAAIQKASADYRSLYKKLNECADDYSKKENTYSKKWTDDLQKKFDRTYIVENKETIRLLLSYMYQKNALEFCMNHEKEFLYQDLLYKKLCRSYSRFYLDFAKSHSGSKKQFKNEVSFFTSFIEILNKLSLDNQFMPDAVSLNSMAVNFRSDEKLRRFFLNHPVLNQPFNPIKASGDFEKLILKTNK